MDSLIFCETHNNFVLGIQAQLYKEARKYKSLCQTVTKFQQCELFTFV